MIYSYSSISAFENCPLKFKFAYIDKIKPLRKNIESFMGIRVHETLEKLYRDKLYAKIDTLEELLDFYNKRWEKEMHGNIFVVKGYDIENYRKMGEMYIKDYYNTIVQLIHVDKPVETNFLDKWKTFVGKRDK